MINKRKIEIFIERDISLKAFHFAVINNLKDNKYESVGLDDNGKMKIKKHEPYEGVNTFIIQDDILQEIVDHLLRMGFRPSDEGSPGQVNALKNHISDLREITFRLLKMEVKHE